MFIVGDIGGTKADIAAFEYQSNRLVLTKRETYPTKDYKGIVDVLHNFGVSDMKGLQAISIGLAAPVQSRIVRLTNLNWVIDADGIQRVFDCAAVHLINDLAAHAYGALHLNDHERFVLNHGEPTAGNVAIIAPGTGLGEAMIYFDGNEYHPIASEGGHASFAPIDDLQMDILRYAKRVHHHVSCERLISGSMGFPLLVDYFLQREDTDADARHALEQCQASASVGGEVSALADKGVEVCQQIMLTFASMLGSEAANLALKAMAAQGVYIAGGIAPKILRWLQTEAFTEGFRSKGRFRELMAKTPVYVVLDELNALKGLAHYSVAKTNR